MSPVEDSIVYCAEAEHIAFCAQPSPSQVFYLEDLGGDEAWGTASDEDVLRLVYCRRQPEVDDLYGV